MKLISIIIFFVKGSFYNTNFYRIIFYMIYKLYIKHCFTKNSYIPIYTLQIHFFIKFILFYLKISNKIFIFLLNYLKIYNLCLILVFSSFLNYEHCYYVASILISVLKILYYLQVLLKIKYNWFCVFILCICYIKNILNNT